MVPDEVAHRVECAVLGADDALRVDQKQVFLGAALHPGEDVLPRRPLRLPDEEVAVPLQSRLGLDAGDAASVKPLLLLQLPSHLPCNYEELQIGRLDGESVQIGAFNRPAPEATSWVR